MSDEALEMGIVDWVIDHPESVAVFERLGIDYCCGGKSLEYACRQAGADPAAVLKELRQATVKGSPANDAAARPVPPGDAKPKRLEPLTDSPLFWLGLFGLAAFVALLAIGPKFGRRHERLQLQSETRKQIWSDQLAASDGTFDDQARPQASSLPLWPLAILALAVTSGSWGALWWQRSGAATQPPCKPRPAQQHTNSD